MAAALSAVLLSNYLASIAKVCWVVVAFAEGTQGDDQEAGSVEQSTAMRRINCFLTSKICGFSLRKPV